MMGAREQRLVFGEVADEYDDVRAGYPAELVDAVFDYCGAVPDVMVEIGAGTGKATVAFVGRVASVTCVEPDPWMAAVLRRRLGSAVQVRECRFEDWTAPPGGVPLLACAQAWHWMDPDRRLTMAHHALAPGGVLALFGHTYRFVDPDLRAEVDDTYQRIAPELAHAARHAPPAAQPHDFPLFTDARTGTFTTTLRYPTARYVTLLSTFSDHRMLSPQRRAALHATIGATIDARGGALDVRVDTELILSRRAA